MRDLYGREEWGQAFLVARRLVEAGVRMVQVNLRGWDTHQNAFRDLKGNLLPSIDHCLSGFLDDLESRGLLDETLIVMCGEMGRTPRISPISADRQERVRRAVHARPPSLGRRVPLLLRRRRHRSRAASSARPTAMAGLPASEAYTPGDLAATIFHCWASTPASSSTTWSTGRIGCIKASRSPRCCRYALSRQDGERPCVGTGR